MLTTKPMFFVRQTKNTGESLDSYCASLKKLSKSCEFSNENRELKSHTIETCLSTKLRRCARLENDVTLERGRTMEGAEKGTSEIENATTSLNKLSLNKRTTCLKKNVLTTTRLLPVARLHIIQTCTRDPQTEHVIIVVIDIYITEECKLSGKRENVFRMREVQSFSTCMQT